MTREGGLRPTSPVHVHVDDITPVHVHMKRTKKTKGTAASAASNRRPRSSRRAVTLATTARARSCSPRAGPWVPAPGKATRSSRVTWQGPTHRLEVNAGRSDLSTDEEDAVHGQVRQYERKIDNLMTQVGTLKNEVDLQKALHSLETQEELLNTSQRTIHRQEESLQTMEDELKEREQENFLLRKSVDITKTEKELLNREREQLMKKLIEVEMDGQAAQQHVRELRDVIRRLRDDNRLAMTTADSTRLTKLKEAFFEKMADFEATNRALRRLLREQHRAEGEAMRLAEQRELLIRKVSDADSCIERLRVELLERDRLIDDLRVQVAAQREESAALGNLQESLESTRAHLQKQLRTKEGDCNRMAVQIRTLEGQLAQTKIENDHLQELVATAKQRADADKEALKKATRAQKQRAERGENELERLRAEIMEKDGQVNELTTQVSVTRSRLEKQLHEAQNLEAQRMALQMRVEELETLVDRVEEKAKTQVETMTARLHEKSTEVTTLKLEIERLKSSAALLEGKFKSTQEEVMQLQGSIKHYEHLVDEYRDQMDRSRRDADHSIVRLEEHQKEANRVQRDSEIELEKVKMRLHQRLQELEPLPELLRTTELHLHEANEKLLQYERRNTENTKLIAELTVKMESRGEAIDNLKDKYHDTQEESRLLQSKVDNLERRLHDIEDANRELTAQVARKEESLHSVNLLLEEKTREAGVLTRQLENALSDLRQQQENARDRFASKERTYQSRVVDLESQLSQLRTEIARIKREKEENERKFNSRLYDLKDRLEQCHSTNRSMQNYVQFLKNSYANVFGETGTYGPSMKPSIP